MNSKRLCVIFTIFWLVLIFCMGGNNTVSSAGNTYNIVSKVISNYNGRSISAVSSISNKKGSGMESKKIDAINFAVRKSAHFMEYLILSLLIANTVMAFKHTWKGAVEHILFTCLLVAVFDEFIQMFVGRSSSVGDVLIDFSGAIAGATLYYIYYKIKRGRKYFA